MDGSTKTPTSGGRNNAAWNNDDEATLVCTLKRTKDEKKWGDNNPKPIVWTICVEALHGSEKISGGTAKDVNAIKRRWQRVRSHWISCSCMRFKQRLQPFIQLKQQYTLFKKMRGQSGWGWNSEKNVPIVSDELFDAFVSVSPSVPHIQCILCSPQTAPNKGLAGPLRTNGFPLFSQVGELVDGLQATGKYAFQGGLATPTPPTQNTAAAVPDTVIDPVLLDTSLEGHNEARNNLKSFFEREAESYISSVSRLYTLHISVH